MTNTHSIAQTAIGPLTLVARHGLLCGVYFPGHWTRPDPAGFGPREDDGFDDAVTQIAEYLAGDRMAFDLETTAEGDAFQRRVWELIAGIPYGSTATYGDLAAEIGDLALARAVGGAVGHNPLSLFVPCHRVVGKDGKLTGYAGGLERKRFLLDLEAAHAPGGTGPLRLFAPA
jgi:methylated-DNA-[protein]-cysteine S-methyltransferase